jgi:hypothetical protein
MTRNESVFAGGTGNPAKAGADINANAEALPVQSRFLRVSIIASYSCFVCYALPLAMDHPRNSMELAGASAEGF